MISNLKKNDSALAQMMKSASDLFAFIKEGDLVEAKLLKRTPKAVYFDLGRFGTGIVYGSEILNAKEVLKNLKVGDAISAKVLEVDNEDNYIELSLAEAGKQKSWHGVRELKESGEEVKVKITAANSGGLMAEVGGLKAFLPVSQLANEHYPRVDDGNRTKILEELQKFVGQELTVKIIDANPRNDKLIISEKEIASQDVKESLVKYKAGDVVEGIISGVADFGAFMRFTADPKIEGLIHISELSHRLVENPKEIVKVDDAVKAKILEIKEGRVTLSLKALKEDPWLKAEEKYKPDQDVQGTVLRFNPFGAFIGLDEDIQGLIHISEFGSTEEMQKQLAVGKVYTFNIISVKPQEKRIILKLKK